MSHAMGNVVFKDGTVLYYEYNGTCNFVINHLYKTVKEVNANWRSHAENECNCGKDEEVEIEANYGNGINWSGKACKECMAFTDGFEPYPTNEDNYWHL